MASGPLFYRMPWAGMPVESEALLGTSPVCALGCGTLGVVGWGTLGVVGEGRVLSGQPASSADSVSITLSGASLKNRFITRLLVVSAAIAAE